MPYVSGFLGFREIPEYKKLLQKLKDTKPDLFPDVIMIDGYGIFHHRGFGSASHLGYETGIPTIGIAKTLMFIENEFDEIDIRTQFKIKCTKTFDYIDIVGRSGKIYGAALKSSDTSTNPIYISIGHKISLDSAIMLTIKTCIYKIPEPIRNSDIKSKHYL